MTSRDLTTESTPRDTLRRYLLRHFAEMVAAMLVGMVVLGVVVRLVLGLLGYSDVLDRTETRVLVMTVTMAVGMSVWMRYRRHGWPSIVEMDLAMALAFVVVLVPFWLGVLSGQAVMMVGHVLMLPAMALAMLRRRDEYASAARPARPRS